MFAEDLKRHFDKIHPRRSIRLQLKSPLCDAGCISMGKMWGNLWGSSVKYQSTYIIWISSVWPTFWYANIIMELGRTKMEQRCFVLDSVVNNTCQRGTFIFECKRDAGGFNFMVNISENPFYYYFIFRRTLNLKYENDVMGSVNWRQLQRFWSVFYKNNGTSDKNYFVKCIELRKM